MQTSLVSQIRQHRHSPVAHLACDVGVTNISIALCDHRQVAPFKEDGLELPDDVKYVIPVTTNGERFAHAKHFEVKSVEAILLMTGSINATVQSLETCTNVEISLIRKVPVSLLDWEEATPASLNSAYSGTRQIQKAFSGFSACSSFSGK